MTWLPRTSFGRVALAVGVVLLLAQLCSAVLLRVYMVAPTARQTGVLLGQQLDTLTHLLHGEQGAAVQAAFTRSGTMLVAPAPPPRTGDWPEPRYYDFVLEGARRVLGARTPLVVGGGEARALWTPLHEGGQWIGLPMPHPDIHLGVPLALWLGVLLILALGVAALAVYHLERPLRRLARAMGHFAHGTMPRPLPVTGPEEVCELTKGFDRMVRQLSDQERERGLFLAGISHDLRTPLARLRLALEMMDHKDPELGEEALQNVEDLEGIVSQFMDYLQGEEGEEPRPCDLNRLLQRLADAYRERRAKIDLRLGDGPALRRARLRPGAIGRLVTNLLDNALHHGGGEICLESGPAADGEAYWFRVLDRGPGIPTADQGRVMSPYVRLERSASVPGSGLGLAIVERIAKAEGLTLRLYNREGGGLGVELRGKGEK